jgi:hypothetical protein
MDTTELRLLCGLIAQHATTNGLRRSLAEHDADLNDFTGE